MNPQSVLKAIKDHIRSRGGLYRSWYVGITDNPKRRLFTDHNVSRVSGKWISRKCATNSVARTVEATLLKLGTDGGTGGGSTASKYVYAYRKTLATREKA